VDPIYIVTRIVCSFHLLLMLDITSKNQVQVQNGAQRFAMVSGLHAMFPFLMFGGCVRTTVQSAAT